MKLYRIIVVIILLFLPSIKIEARLESNENSNFNVEERVKRINLREGDVKDAGLIERIEVSENCLFVLFYNNFIATINFSGDVITIKQFDDLGGISFLYSSNIPNCAMMKIGKPALYMVLDMNLNIIQVGEANASQNTSHNNTKGNLEFIVEKNKEIYKIDNFTKEKIWHTSNAYFEDYYEIYFPKVIKLIIFIGFGAIIWNMVKKRKKFVS